MEPVKFEDDMKDKLDKRRLKPSSDAWNILSERLENEEKKNNRKPYWWLGLAASLIGVLFVVSQFLNTTEVSDTPVIVDAPKVTPGNKTNTIAIEDKVLDDVEKVTIEAEKISHSKEEFQKLVKSRKEKAIIIAVNEDIVSPEEKNKQIITTTELSKKSLTFEEQKVQDVVAKVLTLKDKNKVVTDADIDALLEAAQKEIKLNRLYNETTSVVDANALLQDVETELDQSFRGKVFEALKSSYNSVKTAVVQRND